MTSIDPATRFKAVTPSDTVLLTYNNQQARCKGLFVGGAGNLVVKDDAGNSVTFTGVLAGVMYPISTQQVMSTSTTATSIVALF